MATSRKLAFRNNEIYHVFNRGIDRRSIFTDKNEFTRAMRLVKFYCHKNIPARFSQVFQQPQELREKILHVLYKSERLVEIISFCLMPNHFHFLLKQNFDKGIATFISNFTNAYTKYFNTKHKRVGPVFEGIFKAVYIESEEQLLHVSRYIHLNPISSSIIAENQLDAYLWSSYPEYLSLNNDNISQKDIILNMFKSPQRYFGFVADQIDYAKQLDVIKHLIIE